jgi:uncharacterized lipoprotein YehR (DUF1307 family)
MFGLQKICIMRNLIIILICFVAFTSCKKKYSCEYAVASSSPEGSGFATTERFKDEAEMKQWCKDKSVGGKYYTCAPLK